MLKARYTVRTSRRRLGLGSRTRWFNLALSFNRDRSFNHIRSLSQAVFLSRDFWRAISPIAFAFGLAFCFLAPQLTCVAAAKEAALPDRPNILLCIADDASFPHMGAYGCTWVRTPGFDRVAGEGLLFRNAYTPNPKCAPSRAIILTGRNSWQLEDACNHVAYFPSKFKVYPETLAEHGYFVGKTGKGWAPGVARQANGSPRAVTGRAFDARKAPPPTRGISKIDYAANFADFLAAVPEGQPWCFWYGSWESHRDYEFSSGISKGGKSIDEITSVPGYWPDNETVRTDLLDYVFEIEHFDRHLTRMLDLLEAKGMLGNTLVIVTADNGAPFPREKGQCYEASAHLPLAMMWKKGIAAPGRVIEDFVSFADLAPTFLELAGIHWDESGMLPAAGKSLVPILQAHHGGKVDPSRDHVLLGKERHDVGRPHDWGYPIRGIVADGWLYLRNFEPNRWPAGNPETGYLNCDGSPTKSQILQLYRSGENRSFWQLCFGLRPAEELYDLRADPQCLHNLATQAEFDDTRRRLAAIMTEELQTQGDPRICGQGDVFDRYPYADEANRGFYERFMRGESLKAGWVNPDDFEPQPLKPEPSPSCPLRSS